MGEAVWVRISDLVHLLPSRKLELVVEGKKFVVKDPEYVEEIVQVLEGELFEEEE